LYELGARLEIARRSSEAMITKQIHQREQSYKAVIAKQVWTRTNYQTMIVRQLYEEEVWDTTRR
jgi:hypothetical protein